MRPAKTEIAVKRHEGRAALGSRHSRHSRPSMAALDCT